MNRRSIISLSAITALGLAMVSGAAMAQQKSLKEQLLGSWTLVSNDNVAPDGTKRQILGPNPKGMLILAADGNYTQFQLNPNRPKFKGKTRLELRFEAYNAFNHTQFSSVDTTARFDAAGNQVNTRFGAFTAAGRPFDMRATAKVSSELSRVRNTSVLGSTRLWICCGPLFDFR